MIREDYLGALAPYRDRIPTQLANTFRLDLLSRVAAKEACKLAAAEGGRSFPAVDRLIDDLVRIWVRGPEGQERDDAGLYVEPVQLQVVCQGLWDRMEPEKSGGLENDPIAALVDRYLVRAEPRAGGLWYELSHDRMVEPVAENKPRWAREHLHPMQVQAGLWAPDRLDAQLLSARALPGARAWAQANPERVTEVEREFLDQSLTLRRAEATRRRREIALSTLVGVVGVFAIVAAAYSRPLAQSSSAFQTLGVARSWRERDPTVAAALLGGLEEPDDSSAARELAADLAPVPIAVFLAESVTSASWTPDGRLLLGHANLTMTVEDAAGLQPTVDLPPPIAFRTRPLIRISSRPQASPDGHRVVVAWSSEWESRLIVYPTDPTLAETGAGSSSS